MKRELVERFRDNKRMDEVMSSKENVKKFLQAGTYKGNPRIERVLNKAKK